MRNRIAKKVIKTVAKRAMANLDAKDFDKAEADVRSSLSKIDKAGARRVLHPNTAVRRKSKLQRDYNAARPRQASSRFRGLMRIPLTVKKNPSHSGEGGRGPDEGFRRVSPAASRTLSKGPSRPCPGSPTFFPRWPRSWRLCRSAQDFDRSDPDPWSRFVRSILIGVDAGKRERAIEILRDEGLFSPQNLADADPVELVEALCSRHASIADRALIALKRVAHWLVDRHDGDVESLSTIDSDALRDQLSAINGVGFSLADSILLFGLGRGVARFDRGSFRVLVRHGWLDPTSEPDEFHALLENALDFNPLQLADWSLKLDTLARDYCRVSVAKCDRCPLRPFLPEGGPSFIEVNGE